MTIYTLVGIVGLFTAVAVPAVLIVRRVVGLRCIETKKNERCNHEGID